MGDTVVEESGSLPHVHSGRVPGFGVAGNPKPV